MMPLETIKMNDKEVERYKSGDDVDQIVYSAACRSDYHPCGYGIYGCERVVEKDGEYFAQWVRGTHCD